MVCDLCEGSGKLHVVTKSFTCPRCGGSGQQEPAPTASDFECSHGRPLDEPCIDCYAEDDAPEDPPWPYKTWQESEDEAVAYLGLDAYCALMFGEGGAGSEDDALPF